MPLCVINAVFVAEKQNTEKTQYISITQSHFTFEITRHYLKGNFTTVKLSPFLDSIGCAYFFRSQSVVN